MSKFIFLSFFLLMVLKANAQENVVWSYHYDAQNEALLIEAQIGEGWHLYSQYIDDGIGPVPTAFEFSENSAVKLLGKTIEPESIREYDPNFEGELNFFKDEVTFTQKIKAKESTTIDGVVTYMICNDTMCLPPKDVKFTISINI